MKSDSRRRLTNLERKEEGKETVIIVIWQNRDYVAVNGEQMTLVEAERLYPDAVHLKVVYGKTEGVEGIV